jgi:hypothetical protein
MAESYNFKKYLKNGYRENLLREVIGIEYQNKGGIIKFWGC